MLASKRLFAMVAIASASACTGLAAGPESSSVISAPVPRDSAWARARRAVSAEVITTDVVDSINGKLTGLRYPSQSTKLDSPIICRVQLALELSGGQDASEVKTTSRWVAPAEVASSKAAMCDQERADLLARVESVITTGK